MKIYMIESNEGAFWSEEDSSCCYLVPDNIYYLYFTGIKKYAEQMCRAINIREGEEDYCKVVCFELTRVEE